MSKSNVTKCIFASVFFIPHIILYAISKQKKMIKEDVNANVIPWHFEGPNIWLLIQLLVNDRFFRKLFYVRIGRLHHIVSWYAPGERTFILTNCMGGGFYAAHPFATIINANSIGHGFTCRQNTTIGNKFDGTDEYPTIGDNVVLGANVCIIGNIYIGNNVIVGAGSVVVHDVPDDAIVCGNPARIIRYRNG